MSYACQPCNGANPVTTLITTLGEGAKTDAACNTDLPLMLISYLARWLDCDPQALYDHIQIYTAQLDAAEADQDETGEPAEPAKPPAKRKPRAAQAASTEPVE